MKRRIHSGHTLDVYNRGPMHPNEDIGVQNVLLQRGQRTRYEPRVPLRIDLELFSKSVEIGERR